MPNCPICNAPIPSTGKQGRPRRYCSDECSAEAKRRAGVARRRRNAPTQPETVPTQEQVAAMAGLAKFNPEVSSAEPAQERVGDESVWAGEDY